MYFNRFSVEPFERMISLKLYFYDETNDIPRLMPILHGITTIEDCLNILDSFKSYIAKIGPPADAEKFFIRSPSSDLKPVTFQHMSAICRAEMGELVLSQYSHKALQDSVKKSSTNIDSKTYGVYISSVEVHKKLVFEIVKLINEMAHNRNKKGNENH